MILLYQQPEIINLLREKNLGEMCYFVPFDIDSKGNFCSDGFLAVTKQNVVVIKSKKILSIYPISDCQDAKKENMNDSGALVLKVNGEDRLIVRFTCQHSLRYDYIARGIRLIKKGDHHLLTSDEPEQICPKCGHAVPGTGNCPRCESKGTTLKRLLKMFKPYTGSFFVITLLMIMGSGVTAYQQQWQKLFVDNVLVPQSGALNDIAMFLGGMLIIMTLSIAIVVFRQYLGVLLGSKISSDLRLKMFEKIQTLSLSYHDTRKPGDLMSRLTGDTRQIRNFMEFTFTNMFSAIVTFIFCMMIMLYMNWKMTLISLCFMPVIMVIYRVFQKKIQSKFRNQRRKDDRLNNRLQDIIQGIRAVKIFGRENYEVERFEAAADETAKAQESNEIFWALLQPIITLIMSSGTLIILWIIGYQNVTGSDGMTIGEIAQFVGYATMLFSPLAWFSRLPHILLNTKISLSRIDDVMANEPEIVNCLHPVKKEILGNVVFERVSFGYRGTEDILTNLSMNVKQGEMIGLVGHSGAGKSTIINLIMRLYDVDEGRILIDGYDIRDYDIKTLHSQIGVVLQENYLFGGTVLDNIRFSKPKATLEEVISAAKVAGAHDFITKMPNGYNTLVGEKGQRLSGGERQRIAIARAVLGDPKILILDEATSTLDTESEFHVKAALERLCKGRTTFAIAHHLSTLKNSNRIMVIDQQQVAECGSHEELMKTSTIYKSLVEAQLEMQNAAKKTQ